MKKRKTRKQKPRSSVIHGVVLLWFFSLLGTAENLGYQVIDVSSLGLCMQLDGGGELQASTFVFHLCRRSGTVLWVFNMILYIWMVLHSIYVSMYFLGEGLFVINLRADYWDYWKIESRVGIAQRSTKRHHTIIDLGSCRRRLVRSWYIKLSSFSHTLFRI